MSRQPQDEQLVNYLLDQGQKTRGEAVGWRIAVVTDDSPLTIQFAANTAASLEVSRLTSYSPTIGDRVLVLRLGQDLIVLGETV